MASSQPSFLNGLPPLPPSSLASRSTQLSVNAQKRMLDIETRAKWRVYERGQSQKGRNLERQLATAEANLSNATVAHNTLIEEVDGKSFHDFKLEQQQQYRASHADLARHGGEVGRLRKELNVLNKDTSDEQKRMEEELQDEKEKLEILQELEADQHLGSDDGARISPDANKQTRTNIQTWMSQIPTAMEVTVRGIGGSPQRSPNRTREFETTRRTTRISEGGGSIDHDHDDRRSQQEGESKIGVTELVEALGSAFGEGSGVEKRLPPFSGCPGEWLNFKATFERMNRRKIEPSAIMRRLGEALKGDAKTAVQHLFSNPANLAKAMEVLERRFGRAEFVLDYLVEKAKSCKAADLKNPKTIVEFGTAVEALVENVKSFKKHDYFRDKSLQQQLVEKLPGQLKYRWHEYVLDNGNENLDLQGFSTWLTKQVMIAEMQVKPTFVEDKSEEKRERDPRKRNRGAIHAAAGEEEPKCCLFCEKPKHGVGTCYSFKKKPLEDRQEFAKTKGLCFLCLEPNHMTRKCKSDKKCDIKGCGRKHHPLLHGQKRFQEESAKPQRHASDDDDDASPSALPAENVIGAAASANNLAVIPIKVKGPAGTQKIYAMLDLGASFSMIEEGVAKMLGLQGTHEKLNYTVFGDKRSEDSMKTCLEVSSVRKDAEYHDIKTMHTVKKIGLPPRSFDAEDFKRKFPHLKKMKASSMTNAQPQMVIGINAGGLFAAREILEIKPGKMPAAIRSLLGWYVLNDEESVSKQFQYLCQCRQKEEEMHAMMREFFSTESFGVVPSNMEGRSKDDLRALQMLDEHTKHDGHRWSSCLLWNKDNLILPQSKNMALKRLYSMERKMDKDPNFAKLCKEKFGDYEVKGYLRERTESGEHPRRWYLPWFFATHPTKNPRLVFDAAAKVDGKSLNDFLLKGPDLLRPLPAVLIRFRRHLIGLTGDIKEMFHQVKLIEADQSSQTVLFRGMDRKSPPKELEMKVLFFGSASSPCSAIFAKNRNGEPFETEYPEAVKSSRLDIYMDDILSGGDDTTSVMDLRKNLSKVHDHGGFLLTKWNSSSKEVVQSIPPELRSGSTVSFTDKNEVVMEKTLGIYWDPVKDEFGFRVSLHKVPKEVKQLLRLPTKREMASVIMSLFDPLGFVMPLKIKAMCLMQEVWRHGTDWDQKIEKCLAEDWECWVREIPEVESMRIPRKLSPVALKNCKSIELHCFVDASQDAFASVCYLRIDTGGSVVTPFIMGKARVAPLRRITIPRMELQAAVMGARLVKFVLGAFNDEVKLDRRIFWSDSKTVLCWIRSTNGRFNTFVSNRVGELSELTGVNEWRWIPTKLNVADDSTRANAEVDLSSHSRWLSGPEFLSLPESDWPTEDKTCTRQGVSSEDLETKIVCAAVEGTSGSNIENILSEEGRKLQKLLNLSFPDPPKISNWFRLVRSTAQSIRAIRLFLKFRYGGSNFLTREDMQKARELCILRAQLEMFPEEMRDLKSGRGVKKSSKLYSLNPAINGKGIIVHRGRIDKAKLGEAVRSPPILDSAHPYTKLMVASFHEAGGHWGQERIMNELRRYVWILDARKAVRRAWAKCLFCQGRRATPRPPQMGQLPEARLNIGKPPFYHCGVDYFGPYQVKLLRSTVKRYGVLFTCLSTRAVHLELAQSLDTNDFLNSLARFISIRGKPAHLWSDNGKNFVGAERELRECVQRLEQEGIQSLAMTKEMEFHFICPLSPHMGGSWERLIGSVKKILSTLVKEHHPREDTLRTLLHEVMGIMNSRPITYASVDPYDDLCLTPNDLLRAPCVVGPTIPFDGDGGDRMRKSWRQCQLLAQEFWTRFSKEYLPWLSRRQKWIAKVEPLKVGDIVLVLEDNVPRNSWKKGLIVEIIKDRTGQVRSAHVRVASVDPEETKKIRVKVIQRPAVKLCKLDIGSRDADAGRENVLVQA